MRHLLGSIELCVLLAVLVMAAVTGKGLMLS